jgi:hypothetical protein
MAFEVGSIVARIKLDAKAFQTSIDQVKTRLGKITGKKIAISLDQTRLGKQLTQVRKRLRGLNKAATVRLTLDRKSFLKSVTQSNKDIRKFATRLKAVVTNAIQKFRDKSIPLNLRTKEFRKKLDTQFRRLNALKTLAGSIKIGSGGKITSSADLNTLAKAIDKIQKNAARAKRSVKNLTLAQRDLSRVLSILPGVSAFQELRKRLEAARAKSAALRISLYALHPPLKILQVLAKTSLGFIGTAFKNVGRSVRSFGANITKFALSPIRLLQKSIFNLKNIIIVVLAREAIKRATQIDSIKNGFESLSASIGTTALSLKRDLRTALRGTVSDFEIMKTANNAIILGVAQTGDQLAELANIARVLGRAVGRDAVDAFNDLATGIGRQSRLILDNLGIIINVGQAWQDYALRVGKSIDQLGAFERRLAFQEAVINQGRELMETLGDQADTLADQYGRLFASVQNAFDAIITGLVIPDIAIDLTKMIKDNMSNIRAGGRLAGNVLRAVWNGVGNTFKKFAALDGKRRIRDLTIIFAALVETAIRGIGETIGIAIQFLFSGAIWESIVGGLTLIGARLNDAIFRTIIAPIMQWFPQWIKTILNIGTYEQEVEHFTRSITEPAIGVAISAINRGSVGLARQIEVTLDQMRGVVEARAKSLGDSFRGTFAEPISKIPDDVREAFRQFGRERTIEEDFIGFKFEKGHPAIDGVREFGNELIRLQAAAETGFVPIEEFFEKFDKLSSDLEAPTFPLLDDVTRGKIEPRLKSMFAAFNAEVDALRDKIKETAAESGGAFFSSGALEENKRQIHGLFLGYDDLQKKVSALAQQLKVEFNVDAFAELLENLLDAQKAAKIDVEVAGLDSAVQQFIKMVADINLALANIGKGIPAKSLKQIQESTLGTLRDQTQAEIESQQGDLRRRLQMTGASADVGGEELRAAQIRMNEQMVGERQQLIEAGVSPVDIHGRMEEIKQQYGVLFKDIKRTAGIELISGIGKDMVVGYGNALTDAFLRGENAAKAFSAFTADIFRSSMTNIIGDIGAKLQETLASVLKKIGGLSEGALGGIGKIAQGMLAIGAAVHQLSQRKGAESTIDDFGEGLVDESEAIRGVVAGPTTVAISRVGSQLKQALQSTEALLLRIAVAAEGGSGGGGTINQGSTAANPGLSYRLSGSSQY